MISWSDIHFLRPRWLLLLLLAAIVIFVPRWQRKSKSPWSAVIDAHLLPHLLVNHGSKKRSYWPIALLPLFVFFLSLALAGPTIKKIPTEVSFQKAPLIICMELSEHMMSRDVAPNRLKLATYKLEDLLKKYRGAEVALIAFAGDAHMVVPLSSDHRTVLSLAKT